MIKIKKQSLTRPDARFEPIYFEYFDKAADYCYTELNKYSHGSVTMNISFEGGK